MDCCDPTLYDDTFDEADAERRLRDYRRDGPRGGTARLIAALSADGVDGLTVLDIGAGVGAVHQTLLEAGAASATDVDASGPYLAAARREAERRGLADRVTYLKGDAVRLAPELPEADLVALDRVVCCYPDMQALVTVAATRTRRRLGLVLPKDAGWTRTGRLAQQPLEPPPWRPVPVPRAPDRSGHRDGAGGRAGARVRAPGLVLADPACWSASAADARSWAGPGAPTHHAPGASAA